MSSIAKAAVGVDHLDYMPLITRKRLLLHRRLSAAPSPQQQPQPAHILVSQGLIGNHQACPGLPRGVKFEPTDEELLCHLLAKVGEGEPHPLINNFITSLDENSSIAAIYPWKLPGVKHSRSISYFFHKRIRAIGRKSQKPWKVNNETVFWQRVGRKIPVNVDGICKGFKRALVLYLKAKDKQLERTGWMIHQYHLCNGDNRDQDLVVSKAFYQLGFQKYNGILWNLSRGVNKKRKSLSRQSLLLPGRNYQSQDLPGRNYQSQDTSLPSSTQVTSQKRSRCEGNINFVSTELGCYGNYLSEHSKRVRRVIGIRSDYKNYTSRGDDIVDSSSKDVERSSDYMHHTICRYSSENCGVDRPTYGSPTSLDQINDEPSKEACISNISKSTGTRSVASCLPVKDCLVVEHLSESKGHTHRHSSITLESNRIKDSRNSYFVDSQHDCTVPSICNIEVKIEPGLTCGSNDFVSSPRQPMSPPLPDSPLPSIGEISHCKSDGNMMHFQYLLDRSATQQSPAGMPLGSDHDPPEYQGCSCVGEAGVLPSTSDLDNVKSNTCIDLEQSLSLPSLPENKDDVFRNGPVSSCQGPLPSSLVFDGLVKQEISDELSAVDIEDIPLKKRMKVPFSVNDYPVVCAYKLNCSQQVASSSSQADTVDSRSNRFCIRRKRKKTATDSVETALEEDAPGLLQVLLEKGIAVNEIKLYGEIEDDDGRDTNPTEGNFEKLEAVISKLFFERSTPMKFPSLLQARGSKPVYCLACLISLVEQTRYLQFRGSPVEWGWSRELQSFIFVFESHNRIVLERPEYGYATYFFELVESLPVNWQVKRLVITMKLSSCSRTNLIENRSIVIGEDLSEGEAQVLQLYGWTPNTGLGTMLNYCDRVVHDKNSERYTSDWRCKIGKLLMAGHERGRAVLPSVLEKAVASDAKTSEINTLYEDPQISGMKLEI